MMDARRRALQQQRESQQLQQQRQQQEQQLQRPTTSGRRDAPTPAVQAASKKQESALPDFLAGLDDDGDDTSGGAATTPHLTAAQQQALRSPSHPTQIFSAEGPSSSRTTTATTTTTTANRTASPQLQQHQQQQQSHSATVEDLQRQIAAKKKLLQSTKERETALTERWRATKAQKQAEVEQLNGKIRRVWAALEDEKSAAETKVREAQDQHEAELRAARRSVEQEVKADYDANIAAAQTRLTEANAEEARLRQLLEDKGGSASAKDTVNTALTAAITAVMHKLDDVFQSEAAEGLRMEAWKNELQTMVQREIQTSFAVGVESETQAERDEYERFFSEMLAFWRTAEDQERERLLKMDETLLTDLQSMAQQDLRHLQDEELAMERVYVESREAWAMEHQKMLQYELEAALQRREGELQEQRRLRHDLHVERMRDADGRHRDAMAKEEALHLHRMEQLRDLLTREEGLCMEQQRIEAAAQESVAASANVLRGAMTATEETAALLQSYEQSVEEARRRVETEREQYFREQEGLLEQLQSLAATQCSHTDAERKALEDCASQLRLTTQVVERQLHDEAAWLAEQEATHRRNRDEWEREYRRWQQLVQEERRAAEERFHESLTGLQQSMELLAEEERDVAVERATLQRTFAEVEAAAQREVDALQRRVADVQSRAAAVAELQSRLTQQRSATAEAQEELKEAQQQLEEERAELHEDEARLRDMVEAMRLARSRAVLRDQRSGQLLQSAPSQQQQQQQQWLHNASMQTRHGAGEEAAARFSSGGTKGSAGVAASASAGHTAATAVKKRRHRSDPNRLPICLLHELSDQLRQLTTGGAQAGDGGFVPTMFWTDPAYPAMVRRGQQDRSPAEQRRSRHRHRDGTSTPPPSAAPLPLAEKDLPPPLSASPQSTRADRRDRPAAAVAHYHKHQTVSSGAQQGQRHLQQRPNTRLPRHVDPSSLPLTSDSSPQHSVRGDTDWSPSVNTFTNLVDFSDADTTSQSMR